MKISLGIFVTLFYLPYSTPLGFWNNVLALICLSILICILGLFSILVMLAN